MRVIVMAVSVSVSLSAALLAICAASGPVLAAQDAQICDAAWAGLDPAVKAKTTHDAYARDCLKNGPPMSSTPVAMAMPVSGAGTSQQRAQNCTATWNAMKKAGTARGQTYRQYMPKCLQGK